MVIVITYQIWALTLFGTGKGILLGPSGIEIGFIQLKKNLVKAEIKYHLQLGILLLFKVHVK